MSMTPISNMKAPREEDSSSINSLEEPLLQTPTEEAPEPSAPPIQTVQVVAPSNLEEGYQFYATVDDRTFQVTVPRGGVHEGQTFQVPFPEEDEEAIPIAAEVVEATPEIPVANPVVGNWRDGLCNCCTFGCCHPALCCAMCLPSIAIAQVMRRFNLSITGRQVTKSYSKVTFLVVLLLTIVYHILQTHYVSEILEESKEEMYITLFFKPGIFHLFTVLLVVTTRRFIRRKDNIPGGACGDCCVSTWCTCLAISQMARHTADYDTYRASCCTETGLPRRSQAIAIV